ncbi:hypothetical protein GmHk_11G032077 [Glycine max]|nr:hypothetical protein GmHk_11G032077 [Glycine max]
MVKLICGSHNHALTKSFVGHPYVGRLTKDEKIIIGDMTKLMVKPNNILLTLKEHNANTCTTMKQVYNARYAYRSSIRGSNSEMQQIAVEFERVNYAGIDSSRCGCIMRTTYGLPCACELARYVLGSIPLDTIHMFWRRLSFLDQGLSEPKVSITEEMETISKWFEELDVCSIVTLKSKLREMPTLIYSMCASPENVKTKCAQKKHRR